MKLSELLNLVDMQVSAGTALVVLLLCYFGYGVVKKTVCGVSGIACAVLGRFQSSLVVSGLLAITGLSSLGYGIGEMSTGDATPVVKQPLTNDQIVNLATCKDVDKERLQQLLDYTKARDQSAEYNFCSTEAAKETPKLVEIKRPLYRQAWTAIAAGVGMFIVGLCVYLKD